VLGAAVAVAGAAAALLLLLLCAHYGTVSVAADHGQLHDVCKVNPVVAYCVQHTL
jgi:hypothetical protein